ncbi:hypothetical protein L6452_36628 [Arctium lappa]|uniref:Uncharacterized protein n=1 Tax=Arctium lappa TaxID=4217 RepID=A0ACB8YAY7_ARCLA|nr:hypothetical protein L6452_36628 [Arctium lappa]
MFISYVDLGFCCLDSHLIKCTSLAVDFRSRGMDIADRWFENNAGSFEIAASFLVVVGGGEHGWRCTAFNVAVGSEPTTEGGTLSVDFRTRSFTGEDSVGVGTGTSGEVMGW